MSTQPRPTITYTPPLVHYGDSGPTAVCGAKRYVTDTPDVVTCPRCRRWLDMAAHRDRLDARLVACVADKLHAPTVLLRYDRDPKTHADIPIFGVPAAVLDTARALGLHAEATDVA